MKRRVFSFVTALALCLNLCPAWAFAAEAQPDTGLCPHHPEHTEECGYVPEDPGAACAYDCRVCPIEELIAALPDSPSEDSAAQLSEQLDEILALYNELSEEEMAQVDLSPCFALMEQSEEPDAEALSDQSLSEKRLDADETYSTPVEAHDTHLLDLNGHTLENTKTEAVQVTGTLEVRGPGKIDAKNGIGIVVEQGGSLTVTGSDLIIGGLTYGLDIAADTTIRLESGTYSGLVCAIQVEDGDYARLLADGCAFFDADGNVLTLENLAKAKKLTVRQCTDHQKTYAPTSGEPTHTWTCDYCGSTGTEICTFDFVQDGDGTSSCDICNNSISIAVDENDLSNLVYDGTLKPEEVGVTVTLTDPDGNATPLTKGTDFEVKIDKITDAGQATVTVTGKTFNGTFVKTYTVEQATPGIEWVNPAYTVDYDGSAVTAGELPDISITINTPTGEDLHPFLKYAYRSDANAAFTDGLPKDAGTYQVKAYLEESQNYEAAETNPPLTLTIRAIDPIVTDPAAKTLTFNRTAQELVTSGKLCDVAIADGLEIHFATEENGTYSTTIPTGTDAGGYTVWYKVEGLTGNYTAPDPNPAEVNIEIQRKQITPTVTVQEPSYVYDGSKKQPKITVKDGTFVLDEGQYTVTWEGTKNHADSDILRLADKYTATITGKDTADGGNYEFEETATVEIVPADQNALKITGKPSLVYYGDTITSLDTSGGTADGKVTWSISPNNTNTTIDAANGKITVNAVGTFTVKAERTVANYGTVSDTWEFTVEPKPVTAVVTVTPKTYDGDTDANVTATVKDSDLVNGDTVALGGLTGTYDNANVGTGKTVTLDSTAATADNIDKYAVSYPATAKGDINPRQVDVTVVLSESSYTYDGTAKEPDVTVTANDDNATLAASDYEVSYSNNVNVSDTTSTPPKFAVVTVKAKTGGNYTFPDATVNFTINQEQAKVITAPEPAGRNLTFNTYAQQLVKAGTAKGGTMVYSVNGANGDYSEVIPTGINATTYTVHYKVKGDANHSDSDVCTVPVTVTIDPKVVNPAIVELLNTDNTPFTSCTYDGSEKTSPKVVVKDGSTEITGGDAGEYNIGYFNNVNAGTATVKITDKPGGNYVVTGSAEFEIEKADIVDPAPSPANLTYNGTAQELLTPGTTSGGTVYYALGTPTSEYHDYIPTGVNAGDYKVFYKVVGDKNHNDFAIKEVPVTIKRKPLTAPTIELTPGSFVYDGTVHLPSVTVKDGDTVLPTGEYTWTCSSPTTPKDEGTYTITISDVGGGNYDLSGAAPNTATFTIGKTAQEELVIKDKPAATNYGDTFTLTTSGGDGNGAVTWSVVTGPAAVDTDGNVTINGVGEVTISVVKAGDTNYQQTSAQWTFTAAPKPVTATVTVNSKPYDGTTDATVAAASIDADDLVKNTDVVTIDHASITAAFDDPHAGTGKTVTLDTSNVQVTGDTAKYAISYPDTVTADITQATTTINAAPEAITPLTYNGQPQELVTAGVTNVGFLVYSLDGTSFSEEIPTGTNAGTYTVYYRVDETADYTGVAANTTPISVTIAPKPITPVIELSESSFLYDGTKKNPVVTLKDGDTVINKNQYTVTWAGTKSQTDADMLRVADNYTVTVESVANGNYTFTAANASVEIKPADQAGLTIIGNPEHVYYGDVITTLKTTGGTGEGTVTWKVTAGNATINESTGVLTITGTGPVTVRAERAVPNYGTVGDNWNFNVEPKPVTAEVKVADKVYDGTTHATVSSVTVPTINGDTVTIDPDSITATFDNPNAGTGKTVNLDSTAATVTGTDAGKYAITYPATAKGNINPRNVTVTLTLSDHDLKADANGQYYEYDGTEKTPKVIVTADDGAVLVKDRDYTVSYANNKNVGDATVTVTAKTGGNYTFTDERVNFTIRKASAQLTSSPTAKILTYTGQPQELVNVGTATGGHIEYKLSTKPDTDYGTAIPTEINAGTYTVDYKVVSDDNHTADNTQTGSVTVTIAPKTVVSPKITVSGTYTYDGSAKEPGTAVKVEDNGATIPASEYTLSYRDNVNAGTATVIVTDNNGGNYTVNGTATFEIAKAELEASDITPPTGKTNLKYNGQPQELLDTQGTATGGTLVYSLSENGEYSAAIPTGKAVGEYEIWYKVQGDANHNDSEADNVPASIITNTVTNPTIQVTPTSAAYTGEKQEPTVVVKDDDGLLIDGSEYTVGYTDASGNTDLTKVGTYKLTITSTGSNYDFSGAAITTTFEITPADQTPLTITNTRERVYYGNKIQLGTTGGNGAVTWKVDNDSVATIVENGGFLTIIGSGASVTVTATSTDSNYKTQTATWPFYVDPKPVTALVTAKSKLYDGKTDAEVTATLQTSDFVGSDSFTITLTGCTFEDPNAGTDKKVNVVSTNPSFTPDTGNHDNYAITYPATATASIFKANVTDVTAPTVATGLTYTGLPQELITAGTAAGGTMEYSTDGTNYSAALPTGTDAGDYDIWYRVKGDGNHNDTVGTKLTDQVTIAQQTVDTPTIEFNPTGATYDGQEHKPAVILKDAHGRVIPDSEYTVSYGSTNWKDVGDHEVTITGKTDGNYSITGTPSKKFTILPAGQSPLSIVGQRGEVRYGDVFTLSTNGGSGTGAVTWEISGESGVADVNSQTGRVEIKKAGGPVIITARKAAGGGYGETTATWTFSAEKRPAKAIVTARNKPYDGGTTATLDISWKDGDLLNGDTITLNLTGAFDDANVGTDKIVRITLNGALPDGDGKYAVTYNTTTTASITATAATVSGVQSGPWTYNGSEQPLLSNGAATNGTIVYSRNGVDFMENAPTETNAGKYTVYYKARGNTNYADSDVRMVEVTIQPNTVSNPTIELSSDSLTYDGTAKEPDVLSVKDGSNVIPASEYTVSYSNNINVGTTAKVTITDVAGGNYTVSGSRYFTITAGVPALTAAPQAKDLTFSGRAQALVTAGTAVNGKVMYSLDGGEYSTAIPRGTDAGDYEVAYKVVDGNGNDATTEDYVYVTIAPKDVTPIIRIAGSSSYSVAYTGRAQEPDVTVYVESKLYTGLYDVSYANNTNVGTAEVTVQSAEGGNYQFLAFKNFEITKGKAEFLSPPTKTNLVYNGTAQKLVNAGYAKNSGIVLYSLDNSAYTTAIPTGISRGSYTVFAKVQGNSNYEDSDVVIIPVEIGVNTVNTPTVTLSASSFPYTGGEQKPTVTVTDDDGNVIDSSEYTVTYSNNVNVGTAKVNIKSKPTSNYSFTAEGTFTIINASQTPLTITGKPEGTVCYGDTLSLGTTGGDGSGAVSWTETGPVDELGDGQYKINSSGSVAITATKGSSTDTWTFYAQPKPVTAVVTAASKPYDGDNTATLTVTLSGLLPGDSVISVTAEGHFLDENVGTKTVIIDKWVIPTDVSAKYAIDCPATTTASITPKPAGVTTAPTLAGSLTYNGGAQPLLTNGGTADGGNLMYSLDGRDYSYTIPTGTDAKTYTVWYKVEASSENYKDSAAVKLGDVIIAQNVDTPTVRCNPSSFAYDGTEKTPTVVVLDSTGQHIVPESEYTVEFPANAIDKGSYTVTVKDKPGGNYQFSTSATGNFEIVASSQAPVSIINKPAHVYYGDTFYLSATGGSGSGAVKWSIAESTIATITDSGAVTVTGTGSFTVKAYREASGGYSQSNTDSVTFEAKPKPVTPVVTAHDKLYDGKTDATFATPHLRSSDLVNSTDIVTLTVSGVFASADAGVGKRVDLKDCTVSGTDAAKYTVNWPDYVTATINRVDAKIAAAPAGKPLTYSGSAQELVTAGTTENGIGAIVYSLDDQNGAYSESIPKATEVGTYRVWYKVADSVNYNGVAPAYVDVVIAEASTSSADEGSTSDTPSRAPARAPQRTPSGTQTTVQDGAATTVVSDSDGSKLVEEALASNSDTVVIKPEIAEGETVTKAEVKIPTATLTQIKEANAALTVTAPVAEVTIPNAALDSLSSAGNTVDVVTEQKDEAVTLTLTANGEKVTEVPGGVTLAVPAADATPGTVAVLVHEDGTEEVIKKSVAKDGAVSIPLSGSATVKLVEKSKHFDDVPADSWESDAVAFASARELFIGTSEGKFDSETEMSRSMLTTVLYRLEGSPAQEDVSSDAWYAESAAWAVANGITTTGADGDFKPDEAVTREQFALMLWNYAGKPTASEEALKGFADANEASTSSDALAALYWATEKGILIGRDDKQLAPTAVVTRGEAAQMVKNYLEKT